MKRLAAAVVLAILAGCGQAAAPPLPFTKGFWFWRGSSTFGTSPEPVDSIYFQNYADTKHLPPAKEYWIVFRSRRGVPDSAFSGDIIFGLDANPVRIEGVQLDVDCPTARLAEYAKFLHEFRKQLPPGVGLSITALLDWFHDGTAVGDVIKEVDEFVPQFYDVSDRYTPGIAASITAAKWGPIFNRYGKRFRIGVSTFGRGGDYRTATPLDVASNPRFRLAGTETTPAKEAILHYEASEGEPVNFTLPTTESVQRATAEVKAMGGMCAGVLYFRWPSFREPLAMTPAQVLNHPTEPPRIQALDGDCSTTHCTDLYWISAEPLSPKAQTFRIVSSTPLDYFIPQEGIPIRMSSPDTLTLTLPPWCGRSPLPLGRAIAPQPAEFHIEVAQ